MPAATFLWIAASLFFFVLFLCFVSVRMCLCCEFAGSWCWAALSAELSIVIVVCLQEVVCFLFGHTGCSNIAVHPANDEISQREFATRPS